MLITNHIPAYPLNEYIEFIGLVHLKFQKNHTIPAKCFTPKPGHGIDFFLRDPEHFIYPGETVPSRRSNTIISGQHTGTFHRYVGREFLFLNIQFQPGVLFTLTGLPMHEISNSFIDAESVFSSEVRQVTERLKNADSYRELFRIAENFVVGLIKKSKKDLQGIDKAAAVLQRNCGNVSIDWLARESCLCPRQFERQFIKRMGLPASQFQKIARFDKAFHLKNKYPEKDWLSIALQSGYYDYQHLKRDYKTITGFSPTTFYEIDSRAPERHFGIHE